MTIRAYNFAKPPSLVGDWNQRLTAWFQAALHLAAKAWPREMPFALDPRIAELDTFRCADALARLPDGQVGYRILIAGNRLPTLLVLPRRLLLALVGGLLGETGETLPDDRELTPVEQSLAEYFLQNLWVPFFREAWPGAVQVIWEWPQPEPNPQCSRFVPADTSVVVFTCVLHGPFGEQSCVWLFPRKGLAELLGAAEPDTAPAESAAVRVEALVRNLPMDIVVILGRVEISLAQLAELQVGDVIVLQQRVGEPLTAQVGDETKFLGWAGRSGASTAFRIESVIGE
jgi:flagellar motor switch protein FliM